jgi:methyl coenzyme M reductase gamma subunit
LGLHLLGDLASGYRVLEFAFLQEGFVFARTIITTEEEDIDKLQTKDAQKVPTDTGHPARVHVFGLDTSLQHALELDGDGEGQFHCTRSAQRVITPERISTTY